MDWYFTTGEEVRMKEKIILLPGTEFFRNKFKLFCGSQVKKTLDYLAERYRPQVQQGG